MKLHDAYNEKVQKKGVPELTGYTHIIRVRSQFGERKEKKGSGVKKMKRRITLGIPLTLANTGHARTFLLSPIMESRGRKKKKIHLVSRLQLYANPINGLESIEVLQLREIWKGLIMLILRVMFDQDYLHPYYFKFPLSY